VASRLGPDDEQRARAALRAAYHRPPAGSDRLTALLASPQNILIVAEVDGEPAAYVLAHILDRLDGRTAMFIYDIGTAEHLRRRGAGSAALAAALATGRDAGCTKAFLATERSNDASLRLYARHGGRTSVASDDVLLWWSLEGDGSTDWDSPLR
jgi:ribosomal protein S18 acetylase RimI-like enzyme